LHIFKPLIKRGFHLCAEEEYRAKEESRRHEKFLTRHEEYVNALISWSVARPNHYLGSIHLVNVALRIHWTVSAELFFFRANLQLFFQLHFPLMKFGSMSFELWRQTPFAYA
jgi:hypothetical protein